MAILGNRLKHGISSLALVSLLGACGGSDGGDVALPDVPTPTATVTEANSAQVASVALTLGASALNPNLAGIASMGTTASPTTSSLGGMVQGHADMLRNRMSSMGGRVMPLVTASQTLPCTVAGTMTITVNVADVNTLSVGDSMSITYNQCEEFVGLFTGSVSLTFTAMSGNAATATAPYSATMAMSYNGYRHTVGADYIQMQGGLSLTESDDGLAFSTALSGSSMVMTYFIGGQLSSMSLSNFSMNNSLDYATLESTYSMNYSVDATALGGTITVSTLQPFKRAFGVTYPYQGVLLATGANSTKVKMTAIDAINVRIEGDFNGDDIYEYTLDTTWAAL